METIIGKREMGDLEAERFGLETVDERGMETAATQASDRRVKYDPRA